MENRGQNNDKREAAPPPISLKKNALFNTVGSLTYQGGLWLTTVIVVLLSGYYDSGVLAFAMAVANIFTTIATYNIRVFQVSDINQKYSQSNYVAFRAITILVGFACLVPYVLVVADDVNVVIGTMVFLLFKTDEAFCDVLYGVDQRGERLDYVGISQFVRGILVVATFSSFFMLFNSLFLAIAGMYISGLVVTLVYDLPHAARFGTLKPQITIQKVGRLFKECLPVVVTTLLTGCVVAIPRQYYGLAYGIDLLGIYAAIATPAVLIQAAARYLYTPALVPLAQRWTQGPTSSFQNFLLKASGYLVLGAVGMVVVMSIIGGPCLVLLFGESIEGYTYIFPFVLISTGLIAMVWFMTDTLIICRDMVGLVIVGVISIVLALSLMVPLIALFGMNGINFVIIIAILGGVVFAAFRLRLCIKRREG